MSVRKFLRQPRALFSIEVRDRAMIQRCEADVPEERTRFRCCHEREAFSVRIEDQRSAALRAAAVVCLRIRWGLDHIFGCLGIGGF